MNAARVSEPFRPNVSVRSIGLILGLTIAIVTIEWQLYFGRVFAALGAYSLLLFALSLSPLLVEREVPVLQAFTLIAVFRLVNLTMPVFFELTLLWLPFIYGPLIPVFLYVGRRASLGTPEGPPDGEDSDPVTVEIGYELPWWLGGIRGGRLRRAVRRGWHDLDAPDGEVSTARSIIHWIAKGLFVVVVPIAVAAFLASMAVVTVNLAEIEYDIITPQPLVPSLSIYQLTVLGVVMIGFVGFVEELLFRGVLQKSLERRLGLVPGLLLASGTFAVMHSGYGVPMQLAFAGGVGLLFGILYDLTDSLAIVSVMHGSMNVLVFGVIPLDGGSSVDLLRATVVREFERLGIEWVVREFDRLGIEWVVDGLSLLELWMLSSPI